MKTKLVIMLSVLIVASVIPLSGQKTEDYKAKKDLKKSDMSDMTDKPVYETTKDGYHIKVWLNATKVDDPDMTAAKATSEGLTEGTHHVMVEVKDAATDKAVTGVTAKLVANSPTNKSSSVSLEPMEGQFGGNLTLTEKGEYNLTLSIEANGVSSSSSFKYSVQ